MKLTEARLRQIIREELTEATRAPNEANLQPAPEDGRLELVIKNFIGQTLFSEFLDALDTRDLKTRYATYQPDVLTVYNELGGLVAEYFDLDEDQFVEAVDDYIRMMQGRMANQQMTEGKKFFVVWQQYAPTEDDISRFVDQKEAFSTSDAAQAKMNRLRAEGGKNRNIKLTYES